MGKTPTTSVRRLISLFSRSSGLVDQIFFQWPIGKLLPVADREGGEGEQVVLGLPQHRLDLQKLTAEHAGDDVELGAHVLGVGLGEDRPDGGGDHLGVALGHPGEHVAHEMHPAALPSRAQQNGGDRLLEAGVGRDCPQSG